MPLFNPSLRGKYIKLGKQNGFVKVSKIARAVKGSDTQGMLVTVHRKAGEGPPIILRGAHVNKVKKALEKEGIPEV